MGRKSAIYRLPPEIREKIGQLRQRGRTIDEIMEQLNAMSADVSRSALGRHVKHLAEVEKSIQDSRLIAEALAKNFGDSDENKVNRVNIEIMHSLLLKSMMELNSKDSTIDSETAFFMSSALQKLAQASKQDVERELKIRKEVTTKVAQVVEKVGKKQGISAETRDLIKKEILGG